jgi:glycerophosphoryl diester phosphodiesterase
MIALYILLAVLCALCALAVLVGFLYLFVFIRPRAKAPANPALLRDYAHRGLHSDTVPENSLAAFELACQRGFGIELDVQLSSDGEVMVFHDYTLGRMTNIAWKETKVCDLTCAQLGELALAGSDQTIPTFAEVLALVDGRVPLLVELKGEDLNTELCPKVAALLRDYEGDYCIESFNPMLIRAMQKELPHAWYGQLYTNVCKDKKKNSPLNILLTLMAFNFLARPDFIAYNYRYRHSLPVKLTTRLYTAERFVWTVKDREELDTCHENGEYAIFEKI